MPCFNFLRYNIIEEDKLILVFSAEENATCSCDDGWTDEACSARSCRETCLTGSHCYSADHDSLVDCSCDDEESCISNSSSSVVIDMKFDLLSKGYRNHTAVNCCRGIGNA